MSRAAARKPPQERPKAPAPVGAQRLAIVLDAETGRVDRIGALDAAGALRDLAPGDRSRLRKLKGARSLQQIVEEAFLAGLEYALGDEEGDPSEPPSAAEHQLLLPLIEHSAARRLMRPEVLRQAAVEALVRTAVSGRGVAARQAVGRPDAGGKP
jgi:hypothetical protein